MTDATLPDLSATADPRSTPSRGKWRIFVSIEKKPSQEPAEIGRGKAALYRVDLNHPNDDILEQTATREFGMKEPTTGDFDASGAAYVSELAPVELRGRYMGANGLTWALSLIVGPSAGMALFAWNPNALWIASAICGVIAAVILAMGNRRLPPVTP